MMKLVVVFIVLATSVAYSSCYSCGSKLSQIMAEMSRLKNELNALKERKQEKCQSGTTGLHSYPKLPNWPGIWTIRFSRSFSSTPSVVTGMHVYDNDHRKNDRFQIDVYSVSKTGFKIKIIKWAATILYGLKVRWMACL